MSDAKALKDALRAKVLSSAHVDTRTVMFNGAEIELRQQSLRTALGDNIPEKASNAERAVRTFIEYAYVPGTEERLFTIHDLDTLMQMPFNREWLDVQNAITDLVGINREAIDEQVKELQTNPQDAVS